MGFCRRVAHKNIDVTERLLGCRHQVREGVEMGYVAWHREGRSAILPDDCSGLVAGLRLAARNHHICSGAGHGTGDGQADALGAAGDNGRLVLK